MFSRVWVGLAEAVNCELTLYDNYPSPRRRGDLGCVWLLQKTVRPLSNLKTVGGKVQGCVGLGATVSPPGGGCFPLRSPGFLACYIMMLPSLVPSGDTPEYHPVGFCAGTNRNLFLTVPEVGKSRLRYWLSWCLMRPHSNSQRSSYCLFCGVSLVRALTLFTTVPFSLAPEDCTQYTLGWGCEGHKYSAHNFCLEQRTQSGMSLVSRGFPP